MIHKYDVSLIALETVYDMPRTWEEGDFHNLLIALEYDDMDNLQGSELEEMVIMALQDLEPEEASDAILSYKLKSTVKAGVRQNITHDLLEGDCPWEEYSDISLHKDLFASATLLHKAMPKFFSKPDMMKLSLRIKTSLPAEKTLFLSKPEPAFVARILADGMDEDCILERLFDDQLKGDWFPEAGGIIWGAEYTDLLESTVLTVNLIVYSSANWLKHMKNVKNFFSDAYNDNFSQKIAGNK